MFSKTELYQMIDWAVAAAGEHPVLVLANSSAEGLTRFANSEIHQNVFEDVTDLRITVMGKQKKSQVTTNKITKEGIEQAVAEAIENLMLLPDGEAVPGLVDKPAIMEMERFNQALAEEFSAEQRALRLGEQLDQIQLPYKAYGQLSYSENALALGNSSGIRRYFKSNSANCTVLVSHENGASGYASGVATRGGELELAAAFRRADQKAQANQDPIDLDVGAYTVILEPNAVFDLMMYTTLLGFSGKSLQQKSSFLTDRLGEKVFDEKLSIKDDWEDENALGIPFDFEGTPRQKLTLIDQGVAREVAYDLASGAKAGVASTGHSAGMDMFGAIPINIVIAPGELTLNEIIAETKQGLLVTRFHYMNPVNPRQALLTGLTRDGFYQIENGKVIAAVNNMRMTESMLKAFNQIEAISSDCERLSAFVGNVYVPALKINQFHFTGKTGVKK